MIDLAIKAIAVAIVFQFTWGLLKALFFTRRPDAREEQIQRDIRIDAMVEEIKRRPLQ